MPTKDHPPQVIVIEDDEMLLKDIVEYLNKKNIPTSGARDAKELDGLISSHLPKVFIVDIILPGEDGLSIIARLRKTGYEGGVIVLSSMSRSDDQVSGYEKGADIYLTKQTNLSVIEACTRRLLQKDIQENERNWSLDTVRRILEAPDKTAVKITGREVHLLNVLMSRPGKTFTRTELTDSEVSLSVEEERRVDASISRLRGKVKTETGSDLPIEKDYGNGYTFAEFGTII